MKCKNARTTECRNAIESMDPFGMQSPIPLTVSKEFPTRKPALREEDALQGQEMVVRNFPPFPSLELRDAFDASTMQCLVQHLEERQRLRSSLNDELIRAEGAFRVRLLELDENVHKMNTWQQHRQQCLEAKERLADSQKAKISRLNDKKKRLHCKIEDEQKAIPLHVNVKQLLQQRLNCTRLELKREHMEQHQKECRLHDTIAALGCKWQQECDRCVAAKEIEMQYKMWLKDDKLKQLKSILTANEVTERTSYDKHYRKQTVSSCFIASKTWDCEVLDSLDHKSNSSDCISVVCCVNQCEEHIKQSDVCHDQNSEQPTLRALLGSNGAPLNKPHANVTNPGGSEQTNEDIDRQHVSSNCLFFGSFAV
uniref:Uncharacterized protein n=2 Tax=Eptatretus burgeri TaxID=7764 RepID=A0A8C4QZ94_EPTBU